MENTVELTYNMERLMEVIAPDILVNFEINILKSYFPDIIKQISLEDELQIDRQGDYTYYYNQGKLLMQRTKLKPFCYSYIIHKVD